MQPRCGKLNRHYLDRTTLRVQQSVGMHQALDRMGSWLMTVLPVLNSHGEIGTLQPHVDPQNQSETPQGLGLHFGQRDSKTEVCRLG